MSSSGVVDTLLEETFARLFTEQCGPEARQAAEAEGWLPELWNALAAGGLAWVGVAEAAGGPGGSLTDTAVLLRLAGRHAVPLPIAESSGLLGGWLVSDAGLPLPDGPLSVAIPRPGDHISLTGGRVSGCLQRVPWGARAAAIAAVASSRDGLHVVLLDPSEARCTPGYNLAGEARDALTFEDVALPPEHAASVRPDLPEELALRGALSRALLMAGALEAITELTVAYGGQRHQFGRPIATFQAVAQRLARLASETELAALAADVAIRRFEVSGVEATFEVAAAKATVARAATEIAADAHQVHGAIGMSQEYPLHHFTRRLWAWRQEWGSEAHWAQILGQQIARAGAQALWPRLATGLAARGVPLAANPNPRP